MSLYHYSLICVVVFCLTGYSAPPPKWRVIDTNYPTKDVLVAGYSVLDFGAVGDGRTDCTKAFQDALDAMKKHGGGTVFVPEGFYVLKGSLSIPRSVTLRGDWQSPSETGGAVVGSVLMAYADRGDLNAPSLISLETSAGIRELSIWYPDQNPIQPVEYPWTLEQVGGNNATFKNLNLVNAYQGIKIGPQANELHYVHNVYGTPLKTGIRYDSTYDIGRLQEINFSPFYWVNSGLGTATISEQALERWLLNNANAVHMLRSDWEYVDRVNIEGYQVGFLVTEGARGAANAQFRRLIIRNCGIALSVEKTNPYGMVFTECFLDGESHGVLLSPQFDSVVLFSSSILRGEQALESQGNGVVLMEQCRVQSGHLSLKRGALSMVGSSLDDDASMVKIGKGVQGVVIAGCTIEGGPRMIENQGRSDILQVYDKELPLVKIPKFPKQGERSFIPGSRQLVVIEANGSQDISGEIQLAMDRLASAGGGIVFLPGGDYVIRKPLNVPSLVELRGVNNVPHHTMAGGSLLQVYPESSSPTITLESKSGLRGLSFNYPEQDIRDLKDYPFLIQGQGEEIYILNVNAANPYRYLDLMTHRCDRHYVDYLSGSPLLIGVQIGGGSVDGVFSNMQFNPHYWSRTPPGNSPYFANKPDGGVSRDTGKMLWEFQKENLDALSIGDSENQFLYQNFVFGSLYGIRFTAQEEGGPKNCIVHGHGTDGSKVGLFFEHGNETITMINSELVAMSSEDKTAIKVGPEFEAVATLINTMVWGSPDLLVDSSGGMLALQNLHARSHGQGIHMDGGRLHGVNINFLTPKGNHLEVEGDAKAKLKGVIVRGELTNVNESRAAQLELYIER